MSQTTSQGAARFGGPRIQKLVDLWPGLLLTCVVAIASTFVSEHQGGPTFLYALLLGMALNSVAAGTQCAPGIDFAARTVLRTGVALLGARITLSQIVALGWSNSALVLLGIIATILCGVAASRMFGLERRIGVLTGGATAICGASAAIAIAAVLPHDEKSERELIFTIAGITVLSTGAMIVYPVIVKMLGLDAQSAGFFLGGTIHDVAQVVGAGYSVSPQTGDMAVLTKMMRVAMLLPVVLAISFAVRRRSQGQQHVAAGPLVPGFLLVFAALIAANSAGFVPVAAGHMLSDISRACLVAAIAAVGLKTSLVDMKQVGPKAFALLCVETAFLAALILTGQYFNR